MLKHKFETTLLPCIISGFCRKVDENCALLSYYTVSHGNFLPAFQDNLSVPSSRVKKPKRKKRKKEKQTSVRNYHYLLHKNPEGCSSSLLFSTLSSNLPVTNFKDFTTNVYITLRVWTCAPYMVGMKVLQVTCRAPTAVFFSSPQYFSVANLPHAYHYNMT